MNKLKLQLDDLHVDTFDTTSTDQEKGTVFGEEQCTCPTACTCPGCPTCEGGGLSCDYTCDDSCNYGTCQNTCLNYPNNNTCTDVGMACWM